MQDLLTIPPSSNSLTPEDNNREEEMVTLAPGLAKLMALIKPTSRNAVALDLA